MGRQISFYMDESTELAFIEEILTKGQILCESDDPRTRPTVIKAVADLELCKDAGTLYLHQSVFGDLTLRPLPDGRIYIDTTKSPVIEFSRPEINRGDKRVSSGRLWVEMRYWDDDGNLAQKPEELGKWYASLARWVRKHLARVNGIAQGDYWSLSIRDLIRQGYNTR